VDERRFDALARTAGAARSRRTILGAIAAAIGAGATGVARDAAAQGVGAEAYDLTCRQTGVQLYCQADAGAVTTCGNGCVCAGLRKGGGKKCVQEPATGCPRRTSRCRANKDCGSGEVCIRVSDCCPAHPAWGKCVAKCPA